MPQQRWPGWIVGIDKRHSAINRHKLLNVDLWFRAKLLAAGVEVSEVGEQDWGRWATFSDLDENGWVLTQVALDS